MKSKSSQVICRSFIHSILDYGSTLRFFFFFKTGRSSYCQVCRLPIFHLVFNCDMFFVPVMTVFSDPVISDMSIFCCSFYSNKST